MVLRGEVGHVDPNLGDEHLGHALVDAGDRIAQLNRLGERDHHPIDLGREGIDDLLDVVDVGQDVADHERVMSAEASLDRLFELGKICHPLG